MRGDAPLWLEPVRAGALRDHRGARDDYGIVILASPDGEGVRTVERLAMTAADAKSLYEASQAPVLIADDVRHLYGEEIARLRLGQRER